ncbi:hypothetical protein QO010_001863 [Caulobacter ginsengisoli]|uniref:DUF4424 domain-containing protein n=1 Tax=Caulobacter ginsengisoli TaxID=400775 RepID=A0ABU0IQ03_9CAUL|nr:DUF4424 domain-containing protein [Caulobacter ginsengisoli]MDQ0464092.1 hypothetical protein [Caulobacter ginsengisoli]
MRISKAISLGAAVGLLLLGPTARANDSTAELAAGGLVLKTSASIQMKSEDLFISTEEVRVAYRFVNTSSRDVTTMVAFPMPDLEINGVDDMIAIPTEDPQNILGFTVTVDGKPVATRVEQKAFSKGVDRSAYLTALGIPLAAQTKAADDAIDALPQAKKDELVRMGLAAIDEFDAGKGWEKHWRASWTVRTTFYWAQTFPAGKEIAVLHRYKPSVGASAGSMMGSVYSKGTPELAQYKRRYCMDQSLLSRIDQMARAAGNDGSPFWEQRIGYVLKTGGNWAGPIGDFHLTIDKGAAANLISLCVNGIVKTGPTRFEVRKSNFTPDRDLDILILLPIPAAE